MSIKVVFSCSFVVIVFIWSAEEAVGKSAGSAARGSCASSCNLSNGKCGADGSCRCSRGWQGENCNQCLRAAGCRHGTCRKPGECICNEGYRGRHCHLDLKYCERHQPCRNGGTCVNDHSGSFTCQCPPGFIGRSCNLRPFPVRPTIASREAIKPVCLNGGTCEQANCKMCSCPRGFTGNFCEVRVRMCVARPCANGARCHEVFGNYRCECTNGFVGKHCEEDVNECSILGANVCENGGRCVNTKGSYSCQCRKGFEGTRCNKRIKRIQAATAPPARQNKEQKSATSTMNVQKNDNTASRVRATSNKRIPPKKSSTNIKFTHILRHVEVNAFNSDVELDQLDTNVVQADNDHGTSDQASASVVQAVTYAFLGVAIVLFIIIALVIWLHHSKRKRDHAECWPYTANREDLERKANKDNSNNNRRSMIIDNEDDVIIETSNMPAIDSHNLVPENVTRTTLPPREDLSVISRPSVDYLFVSLTQHKDKRSGAHCAKESAAVL